MPEQTLTLNQKQVDDLHKALVAQLKMLTELDRAKKHADAACEVIYDLLLREPAVKSA